MLSKGSGFASGKSGHAAKVVQSGKTFLRRMFELLASRRKAKTGAGSTVGSGQTSCGGPHSWNPGMV